MKDYTVKEASSRQRSLYKYVLLCLGALAVALFLLFCILPGFVKNTAAYIGEYTVSPDGTEITLKMGVASSVGYLRKVSVHSRDDSTLCLDCYGAFGGVNGRWGARNTFTFPLKEDTMAIALYQSDGAYAKCLIKDDDGNWQRVTE